MRAFVLHLLCKAFSYNNVRYDLVITYLGQRAANNQRRKIRPNIPSEFCASFFYQFKVAEVLFHLRK